MQGLSQDSEDQRYVHTYHEGNHESHQSCSRMHKYTNLYPYACVTGRQYIGGAYNICMFVYIYLLIYSYIYTHKYAGANAAMLPGFQPLAIHKDCATAAMHFLRQRMRQRMHDESLLYYILRYDSNSAGSTANCYVTICSPQELSSPCQQALVKPQWLIPAAGNITAQHRLA